MELIRKLEIRVQAETQWIGKHVFAVMKLRKIRAMG